MLLTAEEKAIFSTSLLLPPDHKHSNNPTTLHSELTETVTEMSLIFSIAAQVNTKVLLVEIYPPL